MHKLLMTMIVNVDAPTREDAMKELLEASVDLRATSIGSRELLTSLREAVKGAVAAQPEDESRGECADCNGNGYAVVRTAARPEGRRIACGACNGDGHGYDANTGVTHGTGEEG